MADRISQGRATALANFTSARLAVDFNSAMSSGEPVRAALSGLTIDPATGYIAWTEGATHEFQHEAAGGGALQYRQCAPWRHVRGFPRLRGLQDKLYPLLKRTASA